MAGKMKMVIHNGTPSASQINSLQQAATALHTNAKISAPRALNSSMISRIHNIKPGCGGCGK